MANNFSNAIDSTIGASNSGATNTFTVTNPSNTASSQALVNVTVGGTSAGDAFTTYTVAGTTNWSQGVDNSASDSFVLSASTALGTTNTQVIDTAGNTTFNNTGTSALLTLNVLNSDTNAASTSSVKAGVAAGSAADPYLHVSVNATTNYCFGIDNSDSDKLKINTDAAEVTPSGGVNLWTMTTAGERTMPAQPAFFAHSAGGTDLTGDGTSVTIGASTAWTEVYDQNSDFNTNGTFTAPVTGRYRFDSCITAGGFLITHTQGFTILTTSNRAVLGSYGHAYNFAGSNLQESFLACSDVDMDAADTCVVTLEVDNGTKVVDVITTANTHFSGHLVC